MLKGTPKVSVLMSAYNSEKYVGAAIEGILNQTFTDFEFIIVNDGSTDSTPEIIDSYAKKDKRIHFVNNKKNQGIVGALNSASDLCRGKYIARMDSDDISLPTRLETQVEYMDMHPECGVLGASIRYFGNIKKEHIARYPSRVTIIDMVAASPIANPVSMIRRDILVDKQIKYNPDFIAAEDYAMWSELIMVTEIHNLPQVLLNYRWNNGNNISITKGDLQKRNAVIVQDNLLNKMTSIPVFRRKLRRMARMAHLFYGYDKLTLREILHHPIRSLYVAVHKNKGNH